MDKRAYLAWLQSIQGSQQFVESQQNESWKQAIDWAQTAGDVVSFGASFVPGGNLVGSAIDAVSAGVDTAQGDYLDAGLRGTAAVAGLIPGGGAAVKIGAAATKLAKAAKGVEAAKAVVGVAKAAGTAAAATKVGQATIGAVKAAGTAAAATKVGQATIGAVNTGKGVVDAVKAAKAGMSGAGAVAKGTEVAAGAAKGTELATTATSLGGRMAGAARTTGKAVAKGAEAVNDYGAKHQSNASDTFGKKDSQYYSGKEGGAAERDFLAPISGEVQSNLVSQGTQPTNSHKRDSMDPAFSYRGAYGMFRPVGYGMNENILNKMVNTHVNKFLKSKKGKELKSEVKNIAKKRVD